MICKKMIKFPISTRVTASTSCAIMMAMATLFTLPVSGFHLSFGHRLIKSNPQLNPASSLIRPIECRNANNQTEVGICMFAIDCMQNKGTPLSVCKHNYFVGTCCRLPDYNNFVGIVYDLRDTESGHLLEARKAPAAGPSAQLIAAASTPHVSSPQPKQPSTPSSPQQSSVASESSSAGTTTSKSVEEKTKLEDRYVISSTSLFPQNANTSPPSPALSLATAAVTATTSSTSSRQPSQANSVSNEQAIKSSQAPIPAIPVAQPQVGESARDADGSPPAPLPSANLQAAAARPAQNHVVNQNELMDSFHIQHQVSLHPSNDKLKIETPAGASSGPKSVYEIIGSVEVPSATTNSGAASTNDGSMQQEQFSLGSADLSQHQSQQQQQVVKSAPQNSVYLLGDETTKQQNIVFANNHQHQSTSHRPPQPPPASPTPSQQSHASHTSALPPTTSDQEFTLGTSIAPSTQPSTSSTSGTSSQREITASSSPTVSITTATSAGQSTHKSSSSNQNMTSEYNPVLAAEVTDMPTTVHALISPPKQSSSPFVDLVSSPVQFASSSSTNQLNQRADSPSTIQTTTPFTSSLSTALLPNVSSHPYSPTEPTPQAPSSLVPAQTFSSSSPTAAHSPQSPVSSSSSTTSFSSTSQSQTSAVAQTTKPSSESSFSQLYSNQHSSTQAVHPSTYGVESDLPHYSVSSGHGAYTARPGGGIASNLYPATKIVSASTGSTANQLIPSLSGLQSAILSHIPFKIANGLSSGLSSYLQAAMKPSGSGGRPLLSSNTAPALQYQQHTSAASNSTATSTTSNSGRTPTTSAATPSTPVASSAFPLASGVRFPSGSGPTGAAGASTLSSMSTGTWQQQSSNSVTQAPHDIVRDAQLVCGRPQVAAIEQSVSKKRVARIVGGNQSAFGQWPWMVSLRQWRKGLFLHKCGAALLNENWAITAAHCVENVKASDLLLRLGEFDVSNQEEPYPFAERRVKSVVSHPNFDPKTFEYDLALLRFAEPIKFERNIVPVCVPSGNDSYVDRMATVIGWGRLYEDGPLPDVIQHVDVPIITNNECEKMYKNAGYIEEIPDMFICAGISKGGRDSCEGDSGGPLTMVDHDGRSYLVGIISWGIGCALPSQPGVYTRITAFSKWINQITAF